MRNGASLLFALLAHAAGAQSPAAPPRAPGTSITGVVRDSVARKPLAEALVQLVSSDDPAKFVRTSVSDSLGRFAIADVPVGRYTIGFFHPMLDSLGLEAALRALYVGSSDQPVKADLGIPSASRLRAAVCGKERPDSSGVIIGIVRDAETGNPIPGVTITGEWLEFALNRTGMMEAKASRTVTSGSAGWYAICNVPNAGSVAVRANSGNDSTGLIAVEVPSTGLARRELYLSKLPSIETGAGRLSGTVSATADGRPLANAIVEIAGGPETRANDEGVWSFANAPVGTRMLEVRALGYYPFSGYVHVLTGAAPVHVSLSTLDAVLDTVRVRSNRLSTADRTGFADRRHNGAGRYYTAAHIEKRHLTFTSEFFRSLSGLRIGFATDTLATDMAIAVPADDMSPSDRRILMRGIAGDWCAPAIFLDGVYISQFGADDLDGWLQPKDVAGIEVYSEATVPNEFQRQRTGCGSIVIWRKMVDGSRKKK